MHNSSNDNKNHEKKVNIYLEIRIMHTYVIWFLELVIHNFIYLKLKICLTKEAIKCMLKYLTFHEMIYAILIWNYVFNYVEIFVCYNWLRWKLDILTMIWWYVWINIFDVYLHFWFDDMFELIFLIWWCVWFDIDIY